MHTTATLLLDFGHVGFRTAPGELFQVLLDSAPLAQLVRDAQSGYRTYELLLIERAGDVLPYVDVVPKALPADVHRMVARHVAERTRRTQEHLPPDEPGTADKAAPLESLRLDFPAFDGLFYWAGDDTAPSHEAWLYQREAKTLLGFLDQLLLSVREAQASLSRGGEVTRHIAARHRAGQHPLRYLTRQRAITEGRTPLPHTADLPQGFYDKLGELLGNPNLTSAVLRGAGDFKLLRMMADEQRRRMRLTGHEHHHALFLGALTNHTVNNATWDSRIIFFDEGLAHGDLYIDLGGMGGAPVKQLVEKHQRISPNFVLCLKDAGDIHGYDKESGADWVLYSKVDARPRRACMDFLTTWGNMLPVLNFAEYGATVFAHERAVIVVGDSVPDAAREQIAKAVSHWQSAGPAPLVLLRGDATRFAQYGGKNVLPCPDSLKQDTDTVQPLYQALVHDLRWIDVAICVDAPDWLRQTIQRRLSRSQNAPWKPWIVSLGPAAPLAVDLALEGQATDVFTKAAST